MCNLSSPGCYASSSSNTRSSLPYSVVSRIINEKAKLWHSRFTAVSGGEPFLWKEAGKGIIDLAREHEDNFFLIYTNGTLLNRDVARQLANGGNVTPAMSVEDFEDKTDLRLGKGVFKKILDAFNYLREAGVRVNNSALKAFLAEWFASTDSR